MPDNAINNANDSQKTYSTGNLAQACGVTVRTVRYYDEKGLLPPSDLTEGELPAETTPDMEDIMQQKVSWKESELYPMYKAFIAMYTPTARKVTCTECGAKDWCAEVSAMRLPGTTASKA